MEEKLKETLENGVNFTSLQQENMQLKLLLNWVIQCDFGLDNIFNDDDINMTEEMFVKKTENMNYIESLMYYAKLYLENNKEDIMKYKLLVNGVDYENFKTIEQLDTYCFEHNINYDNPKIYNIEIKKIK